uniref:Putative zinc-finger domain-containing protein n=1 Tax=Poecilia mexicana TaxID=48701 RepID=A0A3B3WT82_9TELE
MNSNTAGRSTPEDGELEDGEICDDETEERAPPRRGEGRRPRGGARPRPRKPHQSPHNLRPLLGPPPQDFRHMMPYNPGPHLHGPFPPNLRQPDRPPVPPPPGMPLPPPPGLGLHGEPNNRSNFWERSHGALGRFRHRGLPNGGRGSWNRGRGLGGNNRGGPGRPGPVDIHGSPSRNVKFSLSRTSEKQPPRVRVRKVGPNASRQDPSMNESFEDLLSKYKQIQLELDCIRKAETMALALEPAASPAVEEVPAAASPAAEVQLEAEPTPELPLVGAEQLEKDEKKAFQAFNIKPLRHKLLTPAELDELRKKLEGQEAGGEFLSPLPVEKLEEEELSELQLRLLALQSASKKWQQQEQQVMRKSKDRIVKASQEKNSGSSAKQAVRKQQLRTWKLQQQRKEEETRRQEEEERRKREEEIRRIRDLSNQDEQYNRFMKLVGGKRTRSRSRDQDHRKSAGKPGLDSSGNLYQYDNYDEVAFLSPLLSGIPPPPPPLPPPPDDLDPPPKPPFADEEEEEEMLLRETCLMSMANKRVAAKSSSGPPSPSSLPPAELQPPPRGNLSTVSLNTVPPSRSSRFGRLPRHKSVVVSLKDSDDSDSDMDACSSSQTVFGGLEFMIKEVRRTVEATKPKTASGCEKENNPVRTPESLPEAKKAEYRLLKEEIASREKQKMLKDHGSPAAADHVLDPFMFQPAHPVSSCLHRELLQRDEAVLRHLLQQELKKTETLRAAETKMVKLREQLAASEKIVAANRTLLRKLQEQVHRVEQRVSQKKTLSVRLEQDLMQAQLAAGRGTKRPAESNQTTSNKLQRLDAAPRGSERHFAELIAQKRRLQQLESEYALKIQKLKEAQARRNKVVPAEPPPFHLPQPSLHDLSQDKLVLDSEDVPEAEDPEPEPALAPAAAKGGRRSSLRQSSSSFTKPHLETPSSAPPKDGSKPTKMLIITKSFRMMFLELTPVFLFVPGQMVPVELEAGNQPVVSELKPVSFEPYRSPLLVFRSYRFSPYYRTKEKFSLSSVTYSNTIEPNKCFCRFDLTGTCNDDGCRWQHMRNCTLSGNQLFQDILSYNLTLIGCSESSSDEEVRAATESYMKKLFGPNKDRMGIDQKAVLLVSKVNESKRHVPPYTTCKDTRRWKPKPSAPGSNAPEDDSDDERAEVSGPIARYDLSKGIMPAVDVVTSEDRRYFISETDDISNLEASILESPRDTQLWIKLAFKYLNQSECLEATLNTLSRALESNCDDPEVWSHYLSLFSRRGSQEEVREMCEMAVEHAADHRLWWNYLNLEPSFEGKDYVCDRLLQFLQDEAAAGVTEKLSFQLMEALLYRVQLSLFTGRMESALAVLQASLKSAQDHSMAEFLMAGDRALLWLCYIHLTEFDQLPASLYDPAESGPGRLVCTKSFQLPWRTQEDISTPHDILIALFKDAINQCSEESMTDAERTLACMPLYTNLILLYKVLQRFDDGVDLCVSLLEFCPDSCTLRDTLADLHISRGNAEQAVSMWLNALADCPHNAQVFYHCCRFLMAQVSCPTCSQTAGAAQSADVLPSPASLVSPLSAGSLRAETGFSLELDLCFSRWMWLHGSDKEAVEAFERALGSVLQLEDFLLFSCRPQTISVSRKLFPDLVHRCLSTLPSRLELPFNPAQFWSCYHFHNKVVSLYLKHVPLSQRALVLERLRNAMPSNPELGLRLLHQEFVEGNMEQLKFQARMLTSNTPRCLSTCSPGPSLRPLHPCDLICLSPTPPSSLPPCSYCLPPFSPHSSSLQRLLFEAAEGGASDRLRRLVDSCQQAGVNLSIGGVDL